MPCQAHEQVAPVHALWAVACQSPFLVSPPRVQSCALSQSHQAGSQVGCPRSTRDRQADSNFSRPEGKGTVKGAGCAARQRQQNGHREVAIFVACSNGAQEAPC
jgi:hypothetical protein